MSVECAEVSHAKFWQVHVHGPDDLIPYSTKKTAESVADRLNASAQPGGPLHSDDPNWPHIYAHVIPPAAQAGACDLCGQDMVRTWDDCWHPFDVAIACPPEVERGGMRLPQWGTSGRPGREHFRAAS